MEIDVQANLIEAMDPVNGGVPLAIAIILQQQYTFEAMYWIHPNGEEWLEAEPRLTQLFGAETTDALPAEIHKAFLSEINAAIPPRAEIFAQYGLS